MKKTHIRITGFLLALQFLLVLLPAKSLAAEGNVPRSYEILSIALDESRGIAQVSLHSNGDSRFTIALYNENGTMLSAAGTEISGDTAAQNVSVALPEGRPEHYEIKAFLLNRNTLSPLCESFHTDSACAASVFMGDYTISSVVRSQDRKGFDITGSTAGECSAQVTLFSEKGDLLFRETAAAARESLRPESIMRVALKAALPEHFIVRVVLCNEKGYPVSAPYTTMAYTQAHEQFDTQKPEDFPKGQVLDYGSSGFGVLTKGVKKVEAPADASGDSAYTYAAADVPAEGAVLLMNVDGVQTPVKVKSVTKNADGTITVEKDPEATLSDFYDVLNINAEIPVGAPEQSADQPMLAEAGDADILNLSGNLTAGPLKVGASAGISLKVKAVYDKKLFGEDYFEYESIVEYKADYSVTVSSAIKSSNLDEPPEVKLFHDMVPIGTTGLMAELNVTLSSAFEFKGSATGTVSAVHKVGFKYDPERGYQPVNDEDKVPYFEASAGFELSVGPKIEFSLGFLDGLLKGSLSGQIGVRVTGTDNIISTDGTKDKIHGCSVCFDLSVCVFSELRADLTWKLTKRVKGTLLDVELLSGSWEAEHGYLSMVNDADSLFKGKITYAEGTGIDGCPNYRYRVSVRTLDMSDKEVTGQPVSVRKDGAELCGGSSPYSCYLYPGEYTATAEFHSVTFEKDFEVLRQPLTVTLRENQGQITGTVTDVVTGEPVSGVSVTTTGANGQTITRTTNAAGEYYLTVYHGTYTVTFSSDSYQTGSKTWTVEQDRSITDADIQLRPNNVAYLSGRVIGGTFPSVRILQDGAVTQSVPLTAANGFALYLPAGAYTIEAVNGLDQETVSETITLAAGEDRNVQLRFSQTGTLRGTIKTADGTPIPGATVRAGDAESAVTDSNGQYELVLPVGTYSVQVSADGYISSSPVSVTVAKNAEIQKNFQLDTNEGTCGPNLTWKLENGILTISGTGRMYDYYSNPWYHIRDAISLLIIESGVTSIGRYAFDSCTSLIGVTISDSVTSIGQYAFHGCTGLTSVTIPVSVTSIGQYAFYGCASLTSIAIPDGITSIEELTFHDCTSLTSVIIPDSVTSIGRDAFGHCESLTGITIPDSVISIGEYAFSSCKSLSSVAIPDSITRINRGAFQDCTSLTNVTIPDSVTIIAPYAFYVCTNLTGVTIPDSVTDIGCCAFEDCTSLIGVTISDSVTSIEERAFRGCTSLTSVTIPSSVTSIGEYVFQDCTSLTSVTILGSITCIEDYTFYGCTRLTSVTIPVSVTLIDNCAFSYCTSLTDIYYGGTQEQWNEIYKVFAVIPSGVTIHFG